MGVVTSSKVALQCLDAVCMLLALTPDLCVESLGPVAAARVWWLQTFDFGADIAISFSYLRFSYLRFSSDPVGELHGNVDQIPGIRHVAKQAITYKPSKSNQKIHNLALSIKLLCI